MKHVEGTTIKTLKGYSFTVDIYDEGTTYVFRDPQRNYAEVARVTLTHDERNDPYQKDTVMSRVHRFIIQSYEAQNKLAEYRVEFLPGIHLSPVEIQKGQGVVSQRSKKALAASKAGLGRQSRPLPAAPAAATSAKSSNGNGKRRATRSA